jgi:hypothetical protein
MRGTYYVVSNGRVVAKAANVITTAGREAILRYLAGEIGAWAMSMTFGVGATTPTAADTNLEFEVFRAPINYMASDTYTGEVVLRAELPPAMSGKVHEIGIWSTDANIDSDYPSALITSFDVESGDFADNANGHWVVTTTGTRIGESSILLNGPDAAVVSVPFAGLDLSGYEATDKFALAYITTASNSSSINVRFYTSDTNYFTYSFTPTGAAGTYKIQSWEKGAFTQQGTPNWASIERYEIIANNTTGRSLILDGFRLDDTERYNDFSFVSRAVPAQPITTAIEEDTYVEYRFGAF